MGKTALVVVDMLNTYDHDDADELAESVEQALPAICALIERAQDEGAETIYVNDNFGEWHAGRSEIVEKVLAGPRRKLIEPVVPDDDVAFVIKARHSIFYETPLEYLLRQEGIERLVLTGQVTEQCILYSALDAYIRHLEVAIPRDAVAHIHPDLAEAALRMMERNMKAEITTSEECELR